MGTIQEKGAGAFLPTLADAERFLLKLPAKVMLFPNAHPMIMASYLMAAEAHQHQKRKTGEPYFTHLEGVCHILGEIEPDVDAEMICAALLHDSIEDCGVTKAEISQRISENVAALVDALTKIDEPISRHQDEVKTYAKIKASALADKRVLSLKAADVLHTLETVHALHPARYENFLVRTKRYAALMKELGREDLAELLLHHHDRAHSRGRK